VPHGVNAPILRPSIKALQADHVVMTGDGPALALPVQPSLQTGVKAQRRHQLNLLLPTPAH